MIATTAFLLALGMFGGLAFAKPANNGGPISTNLKYIATVDRKSFFAERNPGMNWTVASEFCENLGLRFADVSSKAQYDALKAAYASGSFDKGYWTSGRDAQLPRQFSWNSNGDPISIEYGELRIHKSLPYQTFVFFWSKPGNDSAFYLSECNYEIGVLCST